MKNSKKDNLYNDCLHKDVKQDGGSLVCKNCGLILDENIDFTTELPRNEKYQLKESQLVYERNIRIRDSRAKQDPIIKQKYDKIQTLEKWYRDYETSFTEQKRMIELLKSYGIGLSIDFVKSQEIKKRYLKFNKKHRKTYQNMVIIFLAIVWMEIKETTNVRVENFIKISSELGHKINKKMLNNAMSKVKRTESQWQKIKDKAGLEKEIKEKIKILFQKDLNNIPYKKVKEFISSKSEFDKVKIDMQLLADKYLSKITYENLKNSNHKAFTAGLIYYVGQTLGKEGRKIFTQSLIEEYTSFSSTTIRKKFHILKDILGDPKDLQFH